MKLIFSNFWIIMMFFQFITVYKWKTYLISKSILTAENNEVFKSLRKNVLIYSTSIWLIIGGYSLIYELQFPVDYINPSNNINAFVFFVLVVILYNAFHFYWVMFKGGADLLARFPGLISNSTKPKIHKFTSFIGLLFSVIFAIVILIVSKN